VVSFPPSGWRLEHGLHQRHAANGEAEVVPFVEGGIDDLVVDLDLDPRHPLLRS
jgi:hypothetical protein